MLTVPPLPRPDEYPSFLNEWNSTFAHPTLDSNNCKPLDTLSGCLLGYTGFCITSRLGVGAYGIVYKAHHTANPRTHYAIKAIPLLLGSGVVSAPTPRPGTNIIPCKALVGAHELNSLDTLMTYPPAYREALIHQRLSCDNEHILQLESVHHSETHVYMVLEYCDTDLFDAITRLDRYSPLVHHGELVKSIFLQIADALLHCHQSGIYHCDLKPENILLQNCGTRAKLADFGLASHTKITSDKGTGSWSYMAPETIPVTISYAAPTLTTPYETAKSDVWALGVILVNLLCGANPWLRANKSSDPIFAAYASGEKSLAEILPLPTPIICILNQVFEVDPNKRISLINFRNAVRAWGDKEKNNNGLDEPVAKTSASFSYPSMDILSKVDILLCDEMALTAQVNSSTPDSHYVSSALDSHGTPNVAPLLPPFELTIDSFTTCPPSPAMSFDSEPLEIGQVLPCLDIPSTPPSLEYWISPSSDSFNLNGTSTPKTISFISLDETIIPTLPSPKLKLEHTQYWEDLPCDMNSNIPFSWENSTTWV